VNPVRSCVLLGCVFAAGFAPAHAQVLVGEFPLHGSLNNNLAGGAALTLVPFNGSPGQVTPAGYVFGANQGLSFTSPSFTPASYSLEFSFNFTSVSGWTKIADFSDLVSDIGFYQLNGDLNFYNVVDSGVADFSNGGTVDVVLTRDVATGTLTGYVNGHQRFLFVDSSSLAVTSAPGNKLVFFVDDAATGQREASGGTLNYLRIYDGALSSAQVSALFAAGAPLAVPEASTALLLCLGVAGLALARRRR